LILSAGIKGIVAVNRSVRKRGIARTRGGLGAGRKREKKRHKKGVPGKRKEEKTVAGFRWCQIH